MTDTLLPYRLTALRAYLAKYPHMSDEDALPLRVGLIRGLVAALDAAESRISYLLEEIQDAKTALNSPDAELFSACKWTMERLERAEAAIDKPACGCPAPLCLVCGLSEPCQTEPDGNGDGPACTFDLTNSQLIEILHRKDDEIRRLKEQMDK